MENQTSQLAEQLNNINATLQQIKGDLAQCQAGSECDPCTGEGPARRPEVGLPKK